MSRIESDERARPSSKATTAKTVDVLTPATSETWDPVEVPPLPPPRPTPGKGMAPGLNIMMRIALLARLALRGTLRRAASAAAPV